MPSEAKCDARAVIDFDSADCDLKPGHTGFHEMRVESGRIKWVPVHTGSTGYVSPRETWPDDSGPDESIRRAESLAEALWEIAEKYDIPLTNNLPRWQEGVFLREVGDFIHDCMNAMSRFTVTPKEDS